MGGLGIDGLVAGIAGAALYEVSRWAGLSKQRVLPLYMYKLHYWLITVVQVAAGGVAAAYLNPAGGASAFLVGLSGPSLLSRLGLLTVESAHLGTEESKQPASPERWLRG